jgi:hypothetical protein
MGIMGGVSRDNDYARLLRENQFLREQNKRLLTVLENALKDVEEITAILEGTK